MKFHTDDAAAAKYFTGEAQQAMERQIEADETAAYRRAEQKLIQRGLAGLAALNRKTMSDQERLAVVLIRWDLEERRERDRFADLRFPFGEYRSPHVRLPQLLSVQHAIHSAQDAENYLTRLRQVRPRMEEAIARSQVLAEKRVLPPRFILSQSIEQMRDFVRTPAAENPFVQSFGERMARVDSIAAAERERLRAEAEKITAGEIYPVWRKAIGVLEPLVAKATDEAGIWRFPNGAAAYQQALQRYTTTLMTPEQIHQTGLEMVVTLEKRIDDVLKRSGRAQGTLAERQASFWNAQPRWAAGEAGMKARQAFIDTTIADAERRAKSLFSRVPKSTVIAQPYPAFMGVRSASYNEPAPDGSRPGIFQYTATPQGAGQGRKSTIYHETIPGHHYQLALIQEDTTLPKFQRLGVFGFNSANAEGWGLYAEKLAAESGWYEGDLAGELDQLEQEIFRARRLVVDTGIHAKRWTRQQAINYGVAANEIDRYIMMPGQACSYMIGQLKYVELRERAKRELGERFSIQGYHDFVLRLGIVPLEALDREVDRWIGRQRG
jgi:uncharacterized protein (DUF885 family)